MVVPQARRLARPDVVLRGEEVGVGPTILLLHAGDERRRVWTPVADVLVDAGFRCVAFDQRRHGDSDGVAHALLPYVDDVAAMLHAEPPGCVVVGASLGGLAAIAAIADPAVRSRVAGLVLLDAHTAPIHDLLAQVPLLRQVAADLPMLLVRGGDSPVTDDDIEKLLHLAPHVTVIHIPHAGHLVAQDQPAALAESIVAVTAKWPALALLRDLGAGQVDHPGGNLLDHVQRVHDLAASWGASKRVLLAALCHAVYGTDGFQHALLPVDQRARLRTAIGDEAEALVYLYGACERSKTYAHLGTTPLPLTDRFTGDVVTLTAADRADFALLTIANELDVARTADLTAETRRGIRALIAALTAYVPDVAAQALADPSLL